MKNFKTVLFAFALVMFVGSTATYAQEKAQDVRGKTQKTLKDNTHSNSENVEASQMKIKQMQERLDNATPEKRAQLEAKMMDYKKSQMNNGTTNSEARALNSKLEVKEAYQETKQTRVMLEDSSVKIKMAHERLEVAKKAGTLSAEEISVKEAKIATAEKELKEANNALDKKQKVIMRMHDALDAPSDN